MFPTRGAAGALAGIAMLGGTLVLAWQPAEATSTPERCTAVEIYDYGSGPSRLVRADLPSGVTNPPVTLPYRVNAIGYSVGQNRIYGVVTGHPGSGHILAIDLDSITPTDLGPVHVVGRSRLPPAVLADATAGVIRGDVLYLRRGIALYAVDIRPGDPNFLHLLAVTPLWPARSALGVDDIAADPVTGLLYGVSVDHWRAKVVSIDPARGWVREVPAPDLPPATSYGSVVIGADHVLYAIGNQVHGRSRLYRVTLGENGSVTEIGSWPPVKNSDAAGCLSTPAPPISPPPSTPAPPVSPAPPAITPGVTAPPPVTTPASVPTPLPAAPGAVVPAAPSVVPSTTPTTPSSQTAVNRTPFRRSRPTNVVAASGNTEAAEVKKQRRWGLAVLLVVVAAGAGVRALNRHR